MAARSKSKDFKAACKNKVTQNYKPRIKNLFKKGVIQKNLIKIRTQTRVF